jgi:hypothetical protein
MRIPETAWTRIMRHTLIAFSLLLAAVTGHAAMNSAAMLDHDGLLKRVVGSTIHFHAPSEDVYEFLAPDGSIRGESTVHGRYSARWRLYEQDSLCLEHADPMASGCVAVWLEGARIEFHRRDGVVEGPLELLPGNPRKL